MITSTTLGALCATGGVQTGPFGSQLHAHEYSLEGVPVVMPQDIGDNVVRTDSIARIPSEVANRLARHRLQKGDIVYSRRGDVERRALIREREEGWLCGTGCLRVRIDPKEADPAFVSYYLGDPNVREWIKSHAIGATMLNLNTGILSSVPVSLPSSATQRAIAEVLDALDDKIAANGMTARVVEASSHALFQRYQATARHSGRLEDLLQLAYGKALPATSRRPGDVDVYGSGGMAGTHDEALVRAPGVVVGRKGTVGAVYWASKDFFPIDTTYYVQPASGVPMEYLYFVLRGLSLNELNSDSAVPGLNRGEAHAMTVRYVGRDVMVQFANDVQDLFARREAARNESRQLVILRDALLPHLMSGRLPIRQVQVVAREAM